MKLILHIAYIVGQMCILIFFGGVYYDMVVANQGGGGPVHLSTLQWFWYVAMGVGFVSWSISMYKWGKKEGNAECLERMRPKWVTKSR